MLRRRRTVETGAAGYCGIRAAIAPALPCQIAVSRLLCCLLETLDPSLHNPITISRIRILIALLYVVRGCARRCFESLCLTRSTPGAAIFSDDNHRPRRLRRHPEQRNHSFGEPAVMRR